MLRPLNQREETMKYPVIVHKDEHSAYGVSVPDIPGCFSAGDTFDEALESTTEAIIGHLTVLAEMGELAPLPTSIETHLSNPDFAGGTWALADVDVSAFSGKSEKVTITLPSLVLKKIDDAVKAGKGKNRSAFLAELAIQRLNCH